MPHSLDCGWSGLASSRPVAAAAFGWEGGRETRETWDRVQELKAQRDFQALALCLRENAKEPLVQAWSCCALCELAANERVRAKMAAASGPEGTHVITCVFRAMDDHAGDASVQAQACGALRNMAGNDSLRLAIIKAGGVPRIVRAMARHGADANVQEAAVRALKNLSHVDFDVQRKAGTAKGLVRQVASAVSAPNATAITKQKGAQLLELLYARGAMMPHDQCRQQ
eukprot:Tamp_22456.p1 GENE.Tamp_22456~~Tamp_22456.p1  ORF type:complete len:242 (+),score=64.75 Tamp_22456:46-726(+)